MNGRAGNVTRNVKRFKDMKMKTKDKIIKIVGWTISLVIILGGLYVLFPHIHVAVLGVVLVYLGVRIFNYSTFKEYKEKRMNFALSFFR